MRRSLLSLHLCLALSFAAASVLLVSPTRSPRAVLKAADDKPADDKVVAGDDKLVRDVKKAIDEGISYLRSQQSGNDDSWENAGAPRSSSSGPTALVLLGLLEAGVKPTDKDFKRGMAWLRKYTSKSELTYAVALRTMVFCAVNDPADRQRIDDNVKWLLDARLGDGWAYHMPGVRTATGADYSNTQYALLALHAAAQRGAKVDRKALLDMREKLLASQHKTGGWGYHAKDTAASMNMTTANLCNLLITGLDLAEGKAALREDGSAKDCGVYKENDAVTKSLTWIGERHPAQLTGDDAAIVFRSAMYGLYGIERAGRLTGQRYLGGHDWYEVGCRWLVKAQQRDGSWVSPPNPNRNTQAALDTHPLVSTSFALLFLSKGRTPVLISKLAYGEKDYSGWNNKRNDMKHVVEYLSRELFDKKPLAWQAFDVRAIKAENEASRRKLAAELLQSPIAFVNGHDMAPGGKEEEVLKEFLTNGGFLIAENCCGKVREKEFDKDFRRLIKAILPDAELKELEVEHPIWTASGKFASSPRDFPLMGVKQGCKTIVVYSPVPLAGYWEANAFADKDRGQKTFELMANIVAYATGFEIPRPRLSHVEILADNPKEKPKRGYLQVGQLRHEGDWQPAPKAMRNLMQEARKAGLDVVLKTEAVSPFGPAVLDYRFLYMHGRSAFEAKKEDLKDIRFLLKNGGLLLADSCCGSKTFDASFRSFITEVFGDDKLKLEPIPLKDDLFGAELNGQAIERVERRVLSEGKVSKKFQSLPPALEGVKHKGRWVVIYSKTDLGCALEKHASSECLSHDYDSALRLARAAMLYSLKR